MRFLDMIKKLDIEASDSIIEIFDGVDLDKNFDIDDVNSIIDKINDNGRVSEYADSNTPIYYSGIDEKYDKQTAFNDGYTIDDAISDGMIEPMSSESDISKAKQVALYMQIEQDAYKDIADLKDEIDANFDNFFGEVDNEL